MQVEGERSRVFRSGDWTKKKKIEEEKVKGILDWLTPKCVKDVQKFLRLANYYY